MKAVKRVVTLSPEDEPYLERMERESPGYAAALRLRRDRPLLSYREMADALGISSVGTMKNRLFRAREALIEMRSSRT